MKSFDLLSQHVGEIDDLAERWVQQLGLTYTHFAVLYTLANSPDGQCTQKQICDEHYLPKQTVFNICKEYREKGWIEFHPGTKDKRERIMRLTTIGKAQAKPVLTKTNAVCDSAFNAFGKQKSKQLLTLMHEFCHVWRTEMDKVK